MDLEWNGDSNGMWTTIEHERDTHTICTRGKQLEAELELEKTKNMWDTKHLLIKRTNSHGHSKKS